MFLSFRYILLVWLFLLSFPVYGLGLKQLQHYPIGVMEEAMPWEMEPYEGWLFIAAEDGLIQYDGSFPELFSLNNRRPVRSVKIDSENKRLFVGGIGEFGYYVPSPTESLKYICLSDSIGADRQIGNIWGIYPKDGLLLVQGDNAIVSYDLNSGKHSIVGVGYKLDVSSLINGALWLGTGEGLKLMVGNTIVDAPNADVLKGKRIRKILPFNDGLLVVTSDGIWTYRNQQLSKLDKVDAIMKKLGEVFSADIKGERLAIGSVAHGLAVVDLKTGDFEIYNEDNGLQSNTVMSLKFESSGNLWVGLQYGVSKIILEEPIERFDNSSYPIGSGSSLALKDAKIYLGSNRGLFQANYDREKEEILPPVERVQGLRGQVWGLSQIEGDVFCNHDHGLYWLQNNGGPCPIGDITGVWDTQKRIGNQNELLSGTYSGLHVIRKNGANWEYLMPVEGYYSSMYNFVQESPEYIWNDDADNGIDRIKIDPVTNKVIEIENFTETKDGTPLTTDVFLSRIDNKVYFGTHNGVYYFDPDQKEILKDKEVSSLIGNPKIIKRLKKMNGSIFALTDHELLQADPAGILDTRHIPIETSLARPLNEGEVFFPVGTDHLAFPTRSGFLFFDFSEEKDSLWQANTMPDVRITSLVSIVNGDSVIFINNFGNERYEPKLSYKENSVRINFGRLENLEKGMLYSTRVNKNNWTPPSPILSRELTNLREGKYHFEVKAISADGKESLDSITFRITPPWWRNPWMWVIYAVLMISLIIGALRLLQIKVGQRQRKLLAEKDLEIEQQHTKHLLESEEKDRQIEKLEHERIERELKHKSQEVANAMINLSHKNETLQTLKSDIQDILRKVPHGNTDLRKALIGLQERIVIDIKSDDILKRVEDEFDIVHDNFISNLREMYPDLNNNEIMLCAYIKMNLSTKEIAPLLNISQRGVETMRYRLRKKLGLEREDSLSVFISKF